jgi:hypothetical protein
VHLAGIIEAFWTPQAAMLAQWATAHITVAEAEEFFDRLGTMNPSKSALDRLSKDLGHLWEQQRQHFEQDLRAVEAIPDEAVAVGISLDGIMLAMKDGLRADKRAAQKKAGKQTRGPVGYREASCGTVSFYDKDGQRLGTVYLGRMPEAGKATLKASLSAELEHVRGQRDDLVVVGLADGARDNWSYLESALPAGSFMAVDFWHACSHLCVALESAYGKASPQAV